MTQLSLVPDPPAATGQQLLDRGIQKVSCKNQEFLDRMREVARRIWRQKGKVTSEDIRKYCEENSTFPSHPNTYGAVFRAPGWKTVGFTKSEIPSAHARIIAEWIFIENE